MEQLLWFLSIGTFFVVNAKWLAAHDLKRLHKSHEKTRQFMRAHRLSGFALLMAEAQLNAVDQQIKRYEGWQGRFNYVGIGAAIIASGIFLYRQPHGW